MRGAMLARTTAILLIAAAIAACKPAAKPAPPASDSGRNYVAEVDALPDARRKALLFRAIRDAGLPCQTVTEAVKLDGSGKQTTWRATCEDHSAHVIEVTPGGTLYVTSRTSTGR